MTPSEHKSIEQRMATAAKVLADVEWLDRLKSELQCAHTGITVWDHGNCASTIRVDRGSEVLADLKAAMIEVLTRRIAETRRLYEEI